MGALRRKWSALEAFDADLLIIQECEDPALAKDAAYLEWAGHYLWTGPTKNKGIGVFARIFQKEGQRGHYTAVFNEDINGQHVGHFTYGSKRLDAVDLLLRAICWALFDKDTLGPYPALILPPTLQIDGVDRFYVEALTEPARTGFERYRGANFPTMQAPEPLAKAQDYVSFLMRG